MPRAVSLPDETFRFDLKSVPEGFVVLRRLTYGEVLARQEMGTKMSTPVRDGSGPSELTFDLGVTDSFVYLFSKSIVDHNLEDDQGRKLNFTDRRDVVRLDNRCAQEIGDFIDTVNSNEDLTPLLSTSTDS